MRASTLAVAGFAMLAAVTAASAQEARVYIGPSPYAYDDDVEITYSTRPRVYLDAPRVEIRPSSCGAYHFWNGEFCEDARDR